jgi:hypothetical protein
MIFSRHVRAARAFPLVSLKKVYTVHSNENNICSFSSSNELQGHNSKTVNI